jgi:hypothetical protein
MLSSNFLPSSTTQWTIDHFPRHFIVNRKAKLVIWMPIVARPTSNLIAILGLSNSVHRLAIPFREISAGPSVRLVRLRRSLKPWDWLTVRVVPGVLLVIRIVALELARLSLVVVFEFGTELLQMPFGA